MEVPLKRKIGDKDRKATGAIFTPPQMADYLATQLTKIKKNSIDKTSNINILDPACGDGELLVAMVKRLLHDYPDLIINVYGFEIDEYSAEYAKQRLSHFLDKNHIFIHKMNFFDVDSDKYVKFDYIIANPPYIRTQALGAKQSQSLSKSNNLKGKVDAYYIFLLKAKDFLRDTGISGFITSNKFLTIKSGTQIRNFMLKNYSIHKIIDFGDTKPFPNASVLPCIVIFSNGSTSAQDKVPFVSIYKASGVDDDKKWNINDILDCVDDKHVPARNLYKISFGSLNHPRNDDLWLISSDEKEEWLKRVEKNTALHFSDIGKIKVGIKTTADNVFIGDNFDPKIELLRPLITHRDAGQIKSFKQCDWKVIYTHTVKDGKKTTYQIEDYPYTYSYLCQHKEQLERREYLKKANRKWFEIWVPQNPAAWINKKIVFRDICEHPQFWLDSSGAIVNGDCYWIELDKTIHEDIIMLALAIANSNFIERFYDAKFNTKLYSGKRRYLAQYVSQFPIPNPNLKISKEIIKKTKEIFGCVSEKNFSEKINYINLLIDKLYA